MHELIALTDIPSTVAIRKGDRFFEQNAEQARYWVAVNMAARVMPGNLRGWVGGLDWPHATVVILASGPSMNAEDAERVRAWRDDAAGGCAPPIGGGPLRRVIAINTTFRLAPLADVLYACDARWWQAKDESSATFANYHEEAVATFRGALWTQDSAAQVRFGVNLVRSERESGLSKRPGVIHQGGNSGYQAVNLAYQSGASRIVLLGFDMKDVAKKTHWHGDHPDGLRALNDYPRWIKNFDRLAADLKAESVEVVNCTPRSALKCFKAMPLEEALA